MSRISENRYDWEYAFELGSETPYQITPPNEIKRKTPETLYKYSGLTEKSVEALKEKYIYAPHPQQLNDPFDCYEKLIEFDDPNAIRKFLAGSMEPDKLEEALKYPSDEFKHFVQYNFSLIIYSKIGILSLTEDPHSMLMWAYYSLHQGFAIEYNFKKFDFRYHGPFQMNYQKELDPMSIKNTGICVPYQSNLKSKEWEHEKEWRIIPEVSDGKSMVLPGIPELEDLGERSRLFHYGKECIVRIILGNRFFNNNTEFDRQTNGDMHVLIKDNVELKNEFLDNIIEQGYECKIIFRDDQEHKLKSRIVEFERIEENRLKITQ